MSIAVKEISSSAELCRALEAGLDFRLVGDEEVAGHCFNVGVPEDFVALAHEGAGGVFLLGQSSEAVLYISSEGQAGIVATSLEELLGLMATHPYWLDLLKFSDGGKLVEMLRCVELLRAEASNLLLDAEDAQRRLRRIVSLPSSEKAVEQLHRAVAELGTTVRVSSPEGDTFEGLFNTFTGDHLLRYAQPRTS